MLLKNKLYNRNLFKSKHLIHNMVRLGKRGISPLIATVLLIAFAVSIGAMIMNWGKDVVANTGDCNDVKLDVQILNGNPVFCYDTINTKINVMLKNTGSVDVEGLKLRVISPDLNIDEKDIENSKIKVGDLKSNNINYVRSGKFHVEIVPVISSAGKLKTCAAKAVVSDDIPRC